MRVDKFLMVSRIIKRRTLANEACDAGRVYVNGKAIKASYDVKLGDILELHFGEKITKFEVLKVAEHVTKDGAGEMYRILP